MGHRLSVIPAQCPHQDYLRRWECDRYAWWWSHQLKSGNCLKRVALYQLQESLCKTRRRRRRGVDVAMLSKLTFGSMSQTICSIITLHWELELQDREQRFIRFNYPKKSTSFFSCNYIQFYGIWITLNHVGSQCTDRSKMKWDVPG